MSLLLLSGASVEGQMKGGELYVAGIGKALRGPPAQSRHYM